MISLPLYRIELCISWIRATLSGPEVVIYCILTLASLCLMYLQPERLSAFHSKSKWGKECSAVEWAAGWGIKSRHYSNYSSHRLWNADVWWCLMYMITTFPCINLRSEWHTRGGWRVATKSSFQACSWASGYSSTPHQFAHRQKIKIIDSGDITSTAEAI